MSSTTDPRAYSNPDRFEGGPDPILESIFNEFVGKTVQDLFQHIKEIRDQNQKLNAEIEILKYAMSTVEEYLQGQEFMEAVKTKVEQSNSIFFNS